MHAVTIPAEVIPLRWGGEECGEGGDRGSRPCSRDSSRSRAMGGAAMCVRDDPLPARATIAPLAAPSTSVLRPGHDSLARRHRLPAPPSLDLNHEILEVVRADTRDPGGLRQGRWA